ncbi:hypothetical protein HMPREF9374_3247 [Desmospora sp. 8437]|nr:hypothetical protein HMPREF9374_3247 [Desmospora sp. 8437]
MCVHSPLGLRGINCRQERLKSGVFPFCIRCIHIGELKQRFPVSLSPFLLNTNPGSRGWSR